LVPGAPGLSSQSVKMNTHLHLAKDENGWTCTSVPPRAPMADEGTVLLSLAATEKKRGMELCCAIECTHLQGALF
jgi:hypothetical protein